MENNTLSHWGIKGMRWGIRRYQNKDGTFTAAGRRRYAKEMEKLKAEQKILNNRKRTQAKIDKLKNMRKTIDEENAAMDNLQNKKKIFKTTDQPKKRKIKDLSNEELAQRIERMRLEDTYANLIKARHPEVVSKGKSFSKKFTAEAVEPAVIGAGKNLLTKILVNAGTKALGLDKKDTKKQ